MESVLVTGGLGFVGANLCRHLKEKSGKRVVIIDNLRSNAIEYIKNVPCVIGNLCDPGVPDLIINGVESVVHLAAISGVADCDKDKQLAMETNVNATQYLLDAISRLPSKITKFVLASSIGAVIGEYPDLMSEDIQPKPVSFYGKTKYMAEKLLLDYSGVVETVVLRFANIYGPYCQKKGNIIPRLLRTQKSFAVYGDGSQVRDYIHVEDVCRAIILALNGNRNGLYHIGTGEGISVNQLIEVTQEATGETIKVNYIEKRNGDVSSCVSSIRKAEKELGFKAVIPLSVGIKHTYKYIKGLKGGTK